MDRRGMGRAAGDGGGDCRRKMARKEMREVRRRWRNAD